MSVRITQRYPLPADLSKVLLDFSGDVEARTGRSLVAQFEEGAEIRIRGNLRDHHLWVSLHPPREHDRIDLEELRFGLDDEERPEKG